MSPLAILIAVVYVGLEWLAAAWLASAIGWSWVLIVFIGLVVVGSAVMRRAGLAAARSIGGAQDAAGVKQAGAAVGDASLVFVAGALIALPGLITSAFGLLMLIRPLRRVLGAGLVVWFGRQLRVRGMSMASSYDASGNRVTRIVPGDVVEGEVVPGDVVPGTVVPGDVVPNPTNQPDRPVIED